MDMATTLVSVEEYLRTSYKPACEYIDGALRQKPMPTYMHSKIQGRVVSLIEGCGKGFESLPELTVRIREDKYLVPDVVVDRIERRQQPYPTKPVYLCIEIMSPDDRFSEVATKCEEYHAWGVPFCWIVDPEKRASWQYAAGERPHEIPAGGELTTGEITVSLTELFEGL
jgi:Uma2 family endonuclease